MALETLKDFKEIGEFEVGRYRFSDSEQDKLISCNKFIAICDEENSIGFKIQNGPIKEVGINGCQVDTLIETAILIISGLNDKFPCIENNMAVSKLNEALDWLEERKRKREERGVEGLNIV